MAVAVPYLKTTAECNIKVTSGYARNVDFTCVWTLNTPTGIPTNISGCKNWLKTLAPGAQDAKEEFAWRNNATGNWESMVKITWTDGIGSGTLATETCQFEGT